MTRQINDQNITTQGPAQAIDESLVQEMLEELGYVPGDFEPGQWDALVAHYRTVLSEGGSIGQELPDLDLLTAAAPEGGGSSQQLLTGLDLLGLGSVGLTGQDVTGVGQDTRGRGRRTPRERDDFVEDVPLVQPEPEILPVFLEGTSGDDILDGWEHRDIITPDDGDDTVFGNEGDDTISMGRYLNVNDVIDGGEGFDVLEYTDANGSRKNELDNVTHVEKVVFGEARTRVITGDELIDTGGSLEIDGTGLNLKSLTFDGRAEADGDFDILSGNGNDTLYGGAGDDILRGQGGVDKLYGQDGNDQLFGGDGNDQLRGEGGADLLNGGAGNDKLIGGLGDDSLYGGEGNDRLDANEGDDFLSGGNGKDKLYGHEGDDYILGGEGNDKLYGATGDDTMYGEAGNDSLYGNEGNDVLSGSQGNDNLRGHDGDDLLHGGVGADTLRGDGGNDTFRYTGLDEGGDRIQSFKSGEDRLEFDADVFDSDAGFHSSRIKGYDGTNADLGHEEATFVYDTKNGHLWYDQNGDAVGGEILIVDVNGDHMTAGDFGFF